MQNQENNRRILSVLSKYKTIKNMKMSSINMPITLWLQSCYNMY